MIKQVINRLKINTHLFSTECESDPTDMVAAFRLSYVGHSLDPEEYPDFCESLHTANGYSPIFYLNQ